MARSRETLIYRQDARADGTLLTAAEREKLIKPHLPSPNRPSASRKLRKKPVRTLLRSLLHLVVFHIIRVLFSLYVRLRKIFRALLGRVLSILYYHHRTPELIRRDVAGLTRLPRHLSIVLELQAEERGGVALDVLLDEVAEVAAWCACVGIPLLSVYEETGVLKDYIPSTHRAVAARFHAYFGRRRPSLQVRVPHAQAFLNGDVEEEEASSGNLGILSPRGRGALFPH
jgi:hypothetical protein